MNLWTDKTLAPIWDSDQYIAPDGNQYPADFPKAEIPGVYPVTPTTEPDTTLNVVTGFTIDSTHTQVWASTPRAAADVTALQTAASNATIKAQIVALESQQTPRRLAEALLSSVGLTWLQNLRAQIDTLRTQLK